MPAAVAPILGNIAINLAIGVGSMVLSNLLKPKVNTTSQTTSRGMSFELVVGESVPVSAIYGRGRTGGFLVFGQEYGTNNEFAKFVIVCGKGHYDALEQLLVDEKLEAMSGSNDDVDGKVVDRFRVDAEGEPSPTGTPHLWIKAYSGAAGQVADPGLVAAVPSRWTADHKLTGTPYIVVTMRQNADLFGGSLPRFGFIWRGLRLYDWRKDSTMPGGVGAHRWDNPATWEWSENPAVIRWNFRRGYWLNGVRVIGMGTSRFAQDLAYFTAAANLADEAVTYPETSSTMARYAFGREIGDDEAHLEVLRELDLAMCGTSFDRGGADAPLPAQQHIATFTLEDKHRLRDYPVTMDRWGSVSEKKTAYHGSFVSAADDWSLKPYATRINEALEIIIGGRKLEPFNQPFEYRSERAQGRAETQLRRNLFGARRTETFGPRSNVLEPGDVFTRVMGDWGTMLAIVESVQPLPSRLGNTIAWREWNNAIVPASGESFIELPAAAGASPLPADRTIAVSGFGIVPYSKLSGGTTIPYGKASWTPITDPGVDQVMVRVWPVAGSEAVDGEDFFASSRLTSSCLVGPLSPLIDYTGYAIPIRKDGRLTVPTNLSPFTAGVLVVPAVPGSDSVGAEQLSEEIRGLLRWLGTSSRALMMQLEQTGRLVAEQDLNNFQTFEQMRRQLSVELGGLTASFNEVIEVALGEGGAIATALSALYAAMGGSSAEVNVKWEALAAPEGVSARYGVALRTALADGGTFRGATFYGDVPANPEEKTQWVWDAEQFAFGDFSSGNVIRPILFDGEGNATLQELRFKRLRSIAQDGDGTPNILMDGDTGVVRIGRSSA